MTGLVERLRALMAEAAKTPGRPVTIPADLAAEIQAEIAERSRPAIEEVRRSEHWLRVQRFVYVVPPFEVALAEEAADEASLD